MELKEILGKCDHTLLAQGATWKEIQAICDDGMKYHCASVCIPASYVKQAADYAAGRLPICTVIGFPNGYDTTAAKCFMASDAVDNGAKHDLDAKIEIAELMGAETHLHLDCQGSKLVVKAPSSYPGRVGDAAKLTLNKDKIHLFDKETEQAIAH